VSFVCVVTGDVVMAYGGPAPPDSTHWYYFLLYKQEMPLNATQLMENYTNGCSR